MVTETVLSRGRGGTAAVMTQNEQTTEEHSTLQQQSLGRLDHPQCKAALLLPPTE